MTHLERKSIDTILKKQSNDFINNHNIWFEEEGHNASFEETIETMKESGVKVFEDAEITKENFPLFHKVMTDDDLISWIGI